MEINQSWNWRLTVPKTTKMTLVRPLMTNLKMTVKDDHAVSACSLLLPSIKTLVPLLASVGELAFGLMSALPPQLPTLEIKQTFHQLGLFTGFWAVSGWTHHFSVTGCKTQVDEPTKSELQGKIENLDQHNESSPSKFSGSSLYLFQFISCWRRSLDKFYTKNFQCFKTLVMCFSGCNY